MRPRFEVERCRELAAYLRRARELIAAASSPLSVFPALVDTLARALPLRAIAIIPRDDRGRALVWAAARQEREAAEAEAVAMSTLAHFEDIDRDEPLSPLAGGSMGKLRWIALPLLHETGGVVGVLAVSTHRGDAADGDIAFVTSIAQHLAPLVARQSSESSARSGRELVSDLTALLFDSLDYKTTLKQLARVLGSRLGSACVVDVRGNARWRTTHAGALDATALADAIEPLVDRVIARGRPMTAADPLAGFAAEELGAGWLVVTPLRVRDEVIGALTVVGPAERPLGVSRADIDEIARRAAAAVHNGQLYDAAIASARQRDEVISTVSHDLKNPLGVILMSAARMMEDGASAREGAAGRTPAEMIQRSAQRMRRLVCDLLDAAALDGGAMKIQPARWDAKTLVEDAIDALAPLAAQACVHLHDEVPDALPPIWADADRLVQVLSNLIGNAIKFTPSGGDVRVTARVLDQHLEVSISDTGVGIRPSELPHIFDRFWQAAETQRLGTGLGLTIAKSIVELSGGSIGATSEVGFGTTITFTVPLARRLALV